MDRVLDNDDYFEEYMGQIYSKIIKEFINDKVDSVIEFAPGFRYKIAYALRDISFKGNLYVIDSNESVLEFVYDKYKEIIPDANIIKINRDISESISLLPKKVDLFLANHCIDDMIISKYLSGEKLKEAFDNTNKSKEILVSCWDELKNKQELLDNIQEEVYRDLINTFDKIDIKLIIMSQYKSAYYMKEKNIVEEISRVIFRKLKKDITLDEDKLKRAMDFEFADFDAALNEGFSLKENIQFYENWIAGYYRKGE